MYVRPNFKTKKDLKAALATGQEVTVFSPGPWPATVDGFESVEGPWYPKPHRWYARVKVEKGRVTKIVS